MRRILTLLLSICLIMSMVLPAFASFPDSGPPEPDTTEQSEVPDQPDQDPNESEADVPDAGEPFPADDIAIPEQGDEILLHSTRAAATGSIEVKAVSVKGDALENVTFRAYTSYSYGHELYYSKWQDTGKNGTTLFENVPATDVHIIVSNGMWEQPDQSLKTVTPSAGSRENVTFTFSDSICIVRIHSAPGAEVHITFPSGEVKNMGIIPAEGTMTVLLPGGGNGYDFQVTEPGKLTGSEYRVINDESEIDIYLYGIMPPMPSWVGILLCDDQGNGLEGGEIGLYNAKDHSLIQSYTTDEWGHVGYFVYNNGDYYIKQLEGLPGYIPSDQAYPYAITGSRQDIHIEIINPRIAGTVKVIKTDDEGAPIADVKFSVYPAGEVDPIEELTTDGDGIAVSGTLYMGDYELRELATAEGYVLSGEPIPFSITEHGKVHEIPVTNPRIAGTIKVIKTGDDGKPLSGVVFGVYTDGEAPLFELTTDADGVAVSEALYYGDYRLVELETAEGYELDATPILFSIENHGAVVEIPVTNARIMGGVSIRKVADDMESTPLQGAVFAIFESNGEKIADITSGEDGKASYSGLRYGQYTLRELTAPSGYLLSDVVIPFEITTQGQIVDLTIVNEKDMRGTLSLLKKDSATGEALAGAVFAVHDAESGEKLGELTTDSDGRAEMTLPESAYRLTEQTAPEGYRLLLEPISFAIQAGKTLELEVDNDPLPVEPVPEPGKLKVIKTASDTDKPLRGAVFAVLDHTTGEKIVELVTDADGIAIQNLPAGRYKLLETKAPAGYRADSEPFRFDIADGETTELTVINLPEERAPGTLRLTKTDEKTGKALSGAVFGVYASSGDSKITEITTGRDGVAELELTEGDYYLKELVAPEGYVRSTDEISFRIRSGEATNLTVTNAEQAADTGTLELVKRDKETQSRLEGAVFGVYDADGDKLGEIETNNRGFASLELDYGSYYLRELKAPKGYRLDREPIHFRLTEAKPLVELEVDNAALEEEPAQGAVEVYFRRLSDETEVAAMRSYTGDVGTDYRLWMEEAGIDRMPVEGYVYVRTDYPDSKVLVEGTLTVTLWYDSAVVILPDPIPQTGEALPLLNWALAVLCFGCCGFVASKLIQRKKDA